MQIIGLGRFSTLGGSNNCERSEQIERLREAFTGVQKNKTNIFVLQMIELPIQT